MHAAQAAGCNPVVRAIEQGQSDFTPQKPNTIAKSIAIGNPADGPYVIEAVRSSGGYAASASDEEILEAVKLLARTEGIFTEPAGGATLASAIKLIETGRIPRDESVCVCITGNGLKTAQVMQGHVEALPTIPARLAQFDELIESLPGFAPAGATA